MQRWRRFSFFRPRPRHLLTFGGVYNVHTLKLCAGSYLLVLAILPRVCHQQGLPWLYGDVKPRSLFPVYQTQEMGGLRSASAIGCPA